MQTKKNHLLKLLIAGFLVIGGATGYFLIKSNTEVKTFDKQRDTEFILDAFKRDYYWLVENPEFSVDFMLKHMSPNRDPQYFDKLNIRVIFSGDKPAGFTTYYKKNFYEGQIQFIYVHPDFRNKGYAGKLAKYGINELFKQNAAVVRLVTRVTNLPAIKSYTKVGFKETSRDNKFVDFEIRKKG